VKETSIMDYARYYEEQIARIAYPGTLPPAVKRLCAVKLQELYQKQSEERKMMDDAQRRAPWTQRDKDGTEYYLVEIKLEEMTEEAQNVMSLIRQLQAEIVERKAELGRLGFHVFDHATGVYRRGNVDEIRRQQADHKVAYAEMQTRHKAEQGKLAELVIELREANIKKVRESVPTSILSRLDAIGFGLPAGQVPGQLEE